MNSALVSKLKPLLVYAVPFALISPSLIWIALDKSVWTWDPAHYGKSSVELFFLLIYSPTDWISQMLNVLHAQAPGVSWFGQFFVPLGYLFGSIDVGLLLSILVTQALTLMLAYRFVWELSNHDRLVAFISCLVIASAPLFVGMSHQYFAEPLQLLSVTWFVMIMSFAPQWDRGFIFSQLLIATSVAMLAKVSSPLYCAGPSLVALWYAFKRRPFPLLKEKWIQTHVLVSSSLGVLVSLATLVWYYRNINFVIQHVSTASSGPIAELYGKKDTFLNALLFWLGAVQNSFFLPIVLLLSGLVFVFGIVRYFVQRKVQFEHFTICCVIALLQIMIVLATFSLNSNRDTRYLLPLLPYFAIVIGWSVIQINSDVLRRLAVFVFLLQLVTSYGQALGVIPRIPAVSGWLLPLNRDQKEATVLNSIVSKTCVGTDSHRHWTIIGMEKPWLNNNSASYFAAKSLAPHGRVGCRYGSILNFYEFNPEKIWSHMLSLKIRYYVALNPDLYPVPLDSLSQAINGNYLPLLNKIQTSDLFELEPRLAEDQGVWIFRLKEVRPFNHEEASVVAEHGIRAVRGARFGWYFELLGALLTPVAEGVELKLAWRSVGEARLEYMVAVHLLDEAGNILAQSDYAQAAEPASVRPGETWVDRVNVPAEKLKGAQQVGIALYRTGQDLEPIDRGPRDWDGHRLLLPIGKGMGE